MSLSESFKESKDIKVWVTSNEVKPIDQFGEVECPPCIKKMANSQFCGDQLVASYLCFQENSKDGKKLDDCAKSFAQLRECMMSYPIKFYDALFKRLVLK
ncbi:hypothetical protein DICPUDRAFT_155803 [Dictyostelium purpureum]|uniref:GCK domain-containing protein n=1 Tax=Dictyostelium purpureum TaxID=5786 RepID=F0ZUX6_DICPU|nr:uncharacterized protein DICPUDRAFT_155803 [Dictyostelium purpureum]EGC32255.1 hypothetical protein DICPUDRAFT_155803 [Dictyostelium purpureum]|eukprot:XP_003291222.1 hypothetical protein DICPUDRAFT_155803 [Dictyostelium purpureum]